MVVPLLAVGVTTATAVAVGVLNAVVAYAWVSVNGGLNYRLTVEFALVVGLLITGLVAMAAVPAYLLGHYGVVSPVLVWLAVTYAFFDVQTDGGPGDSLAPFVYYWIVPVALMFVFALVEVGLRWLVELGVGSLL